ncbi:MAG: ABC transporter substrate-binding protein, partial [Bauldia sp.]
MAMHWKSLLAGALLAGSLAATAPGYAQAAQTLVVGIPQALLGLDPQGSLAAERPVQLVAKQVFDTLVARDGDKFVGRLATSWQNPDDLTWVFKLRPGVKFQDGTLFTAADVKASFDRVIALKAPLSLLFSDVDHVETSDDDTVTFKTKTPSGTLLSSLGLLYVGPAARINDDAFWQHPVGTGPFAISAYTAGETVDFTANASYWGGAPKLDGIEFRYIPEIVSRITALETGEIDLTWDIPTDQTAEVQGDADLVYQTAPSLTYYFSWFNSSVTPFTDVRVRQAMWYALDVPKIVKDLYGDMAQVAQGPIPQTAFGAAVMTPYTYDPAKAKKLLADAGFPNGFSTTLDWSHECCQNVSQLASTMISYWAKIGVTVTPAEKQRAQWQSDFLALKWNMNVLTNVVLTGDADYTLGRLYPCKGKRTGYCNPKLDDLLTQARATVDLDKRRDLYKQAQEIIWNDAIGVFPMDLKVNAAWRKNIAGFVPPTDDVPSFAAVAKN